MPKFALHSYRQEKAVDWVVEVGCESTAKKHPKKVVEDGGILHSDMSFDLHDWVSCLFLGPHQFRLHYV